MTLYFERMCKVASTAVALVLTSILLSLTFGVRMGLLSLGLALVGWLMCSAGLYFLSAKVGWLRVEDE